MLMIVLWFMIGPEISMQKGEEIKGNHIPFCLPRQLGDFTSHIPLSEEKKSELQIEENKAGFSNRTITVNRRGVTMAMLHSLSAPPPQAQQRSSTCHVRRQEPRAQVPCFLLNGTANVGDYKMWFAIFHSPWKQSWSIRGRSAVQLLFCASGRYMPLLRRHFISTQHCY